MSDAPTNPQMALLASVRMYVPAGATTLEMRAEDVLRAADAFLVWLDLYDAKRTLPESSGDE